jgi:zinc transporter ZupT
LNNRKLAAIKSELKQLPLMLGKLLGGIMAVVGFAATVLIVTRKADQSLADILPFVFLGGAGIIIFVLSSMLLNKSLSEKPAETIIPNDRTSSSILSWVILLLLGAAFLCCTYLLTR